MRPAMERVTTQKEIEAVLRLDGPTRFQHFVKRVADAELAWGLWQGGWAMMGDDAGSSAFPLWPAQEYAALLRTDDWAAMEPSRIELDRLLEELLPTLLRSATRLAVFPTPGGRGVVVTADALEAALRRELERYW
jgi:Protein of unknown function (DUF2750)